MFYNKDELQLASMNGLYNYYIHEKRGGLGFILPTGFKTDIPFHQRQFASFVSERADRRLFENGKLPNNHTGLRLVTKKPKIRKLKFKHNPTLRYMDVVTHSSLTFPHTEYARIIDTTVPTSPLTYFTQPMYKLDVNEFKAIEGDLVYAQPDARLFKDFNKALKAGTIKVLKKKTLLTWNKVVVEVISQQKIDKITQKREKEFLQSNGVGFKNPILITSLKRPWRVVESRLSNLPLIPKIKISTTIPSSSI